MKRMPYEILRVSRIDHVAGTGEYRRFFSVVSASDGHEYQVRFNGPATRGNQNEFIANTIGREMGAPVLDGAFLRFTRQQLEEVAEIAKDTFGFTPTLDPYKKMNLFGVRWHDGSITPKSDQAVVREISKCANKKDFFAIFPFDQYLRNYDRQYFNHLILKEGDQRKQRMYAAIDGDRIFGSVGWSKVESETEKTDCFDMPFHKTLYSLVDDSGFTNAFRFAAAIDSMPESVITAIIDTLRTFYDNRKDELDKIERFLKIRRLKMIHVCNGTCFPNVAQKRLIEDGTVHRRRNTGRSV